MKPLRHSRLWWSLLLMLGGFASVWLRRFLPHELAALISDEFIAALGTALGLTGAALKADDARKFRAAGEAAATDAAMVLLAVVTAALLSAPGCAAAPVWDRCTATITGHPAKPAPAGVVEAKCSRKLVCDNVSQTGNAVACDGAPVVEVAP